MATREIARRLINGVWRTVVADEGGVPGGAPTLAQVLAQGADANSVGITNLPDGVNPQDAATVAQIGGSQPGLQSVSVPISAAELLAWDPMDDATWPEILPALTGQQFYQFCSATLDFTAGTAYNENAVAVQLVSPEDGVLVMNLGTVDFTGASTSKIGAGSWGTPQSLPVSDWVGANAQTLFWLASAITGGTGTVVVKATYLVGDLT